MKIKKYMVIGLFLLLSSLFVTGGKITVKEGATTNIDQDLSITGNVGIGTTAPGAKLDVVQGGYVSERNDAARLGRLVFTNIYGGYGEMGEGFYIDGSTYKYRYTDTAAKIKFASGDITFSGAAAGTAGNTITWSDNMIIKQGGNVGIGTTSPTAKLHVNGAAIATSFNSKTLSGTGLTCITVAVPSSVGTYTTATCPGGYSRTGCAPGGENQAAQPTANGCQCYTYSGGGFGNLCTAICCKVN